MSLLAGSLHSQISILLFVCFSGPATDDKHCFDCLLVSTINLLGPRRTEENTIKHLKMLKIEKSESGFGLAQLKAKQKCNEARLHIKRVQ